MEQGEVVMALKSIKIVRTPEPRVKRQATCPKCNWISPEVVGTNFVSSIYTKHQQLKHNRTKKGN